MSFVYLLDFFSSGIQSYLLLSPYLCFISLLYLDLYVLGDDALIRGLSFKRNIYVSYTHRHSELNKIQSCTMFVKKSGKGISVLKRVAERPFRSQWMNAMLSRFRRALSVSRIQAFTYLHFEQRRWPPTAQKITCT